MDRRDYLRTVHRCAFGFDCPSPAHPTTRDSPINGRHNASSPWYPDIDAPAPYRQNKRFLLAQQEGRFNRCRREFPYRALEADHVIPQRAGALDNIENQLLLCAHCSRVKAGTAAAVSGGEAARVWVSRRDHQTVSAASLLPSRQSIAYTGSYHPCRRTVRNKRDGTPRLGTKCCLTPSRIERETRARATAHDLDYPFHIGFRPRYCR